MRVLGFVFVVLLSTVALLGSGVLIAVQHPRTDGWTYLAAVSASLSIISPVLLGSLYAYTDPDRSARTRVVRRGWFAFGTAELLAAVGLLVWASSTGAPPWVPALLVGIAVLLTAVAVPAGRVFARTGAPIPATGVPGSSVDLRRRIIAIVATFVIALAASSVVFGIFAPPGNGVAGLFDVLQMTFIASSFAAIIGSWGLQRRLREVTGAVIWRARAFSDVVFKRKAVPLAEGDGPAVARYAVIAAALSLFQITSVLLLYLGLVAGQVSSGMDGRSSAFGVGTLVLLSALLLVMVPLSVRRGAYARAYARQNAHLIVDLRPAVPNALRDAPKS